jgi:transposase
MRPFGSPDQLQNRRHQAVALLEKGFSPVDIAKRLHVDRRSVRRWKAAHRRHGLQGLRARPASGRPPKLDDASKRQLERYLFQGAQAQGFSTPLWTCPRILQVIRRQFHVEYHVDHVGRLLQSLGWSPQKPERQARERDERGIRRWVKRDWPLIKKKPAR